MANRQFPPNVKFLHRQFHLINCLLLEKNDLQKTLKKSPVGHLAHWGFFLTPHPQRFLRASFSLIKNSRRITERQPYFVLTWRAVKKILFLIKKQYNVFLRFLEVLAAIGLVFYL